LSDFLKEQKKDDMIVVSPDVGAIKMARAFAKRLGADLAVVDKRRVDSTNAQVMNVLGEVKGKKAIIVDDMVSTAGSLVEAAAALKEKGASEVVAAITHPVLVGPALKRIAGSCLTKLYVTNTIPLGKEKAHKKIEVLSVAGLLSEAIRRIHQEESVSSLFN